MHWGVNAREYVGNPAKREWFAKLAAIQRDVVAPLVGRKLVGFRHDRSAIFRDGYDPVCEDDDGYGVADYEGDCLARQNLVETDAGGIDCAADGTRGDGRGSDGFHFAAVLGN